MSFSIPATSSRLTLIGQPTVRVLHLALRIEAQIFFPNLAIILFISSKAYFANCF